MESIQEFFVNLWQKFRAWIGANPLRAGLWAGAIVLFIIGFFVPVPEPHVELAGQPIFSQGPRWLTNSVITTVIVDVVLIFIAVLATARMTFVPGGWQNAMEMAIEALYNLAESVAGDRARQFFPWIATIFLFVLLCNWSELLPGVGSIVYYHHGSSGENAQPVGAQLAMSHGKLVLIGASTGGEAPLAQAESPATDEGEEAEHVEYVPLFRPPSADLNMTLALAASTMIMVQIWGVRTQGVKYFAKFTNTQGPNVGMRIIAGFVSVLEILSEFVRVIAFTFRLFGNIFAGDVVLLTMAFLIPFLLPLPFYALEVFVGVIQAFVFMMLTLVFFTLATISHAHPEEGHDSHASHATVAEAELDVPAAA